MKLKALHIHMASKYRHIHVRSGARVHTCINFKFSTPPCVKQQMSLPKVRPQNTLEFFSYIALRGQRGQSAF